MTFRSTLRRAAGLLVRNPVLLVPGLAVGALAGLAEALLAPQAPDALDTSHLRLWVSEGFGVFAFVVALALSTTMADRAWRTGHARFADGTRAFRRDGSRVAVATLAVGLTGAVAAVLASYTVFLSTAVWAYAGIYAIAAAVAGGRTGLGAVRDSARLALRKPVTTFVLIFALACVAVAATLLSALLSGVAHAGPFVAAIVTDVPVGFFALVTVGAFEPPEDGSATT